MSRSGYHRIARLGTHPAFRLSLACLACPLCGETFERVPAYTQHFLAHEPDADEARQWLDWRAFERFEATRATSPRQRRSTNQEDR